MEYRVHFKTKHVLAVDKANTLTMKQLFLYIVPVFNLKEKVYQESSNNPENQTLFRRGLKTPHAHSGVEI